jgi:multisubunit Na+/H+ antiporter MnhB subunit
MKKADWQYLVDSLMFICIAGIAMIGILLAFFIPQGPSSPESSKYFLNLHRHQWGNIHLYLSIAFVLLVIIHLTLDWKWIKARAGQIFKRGWKMALISTALASLLVLFFFWIFYPKEPGAYEQYGGGRGRQAADHSLHESSSGEAETYPGEQDQGTLTVTGQMTLQELEKLSGVPASRIVESLGLPSTISEKETIGRLRKKYGFSLVDMRDILTRLMNEETEKYEPKTSFADIPEQIQGEEEENLVHGRLEEEEGGILITGQMSMSQIERQTGVSAQKIIEKLGLPENVSLNENLGRLRRRYGFSITELREIVASLMKNR